MGKSRYSDCEVLDRRFFSTYRLPTYAQGMRQVDLLEGVRTTEHVFKRGERIDQLASRYYNEASYWWVICLVNDIKYPFASGGLVPGRILKIPQEPRDIFEKISSK